jgi:alkylation response protein AidB-like acyl-CoA dehydrogenase
MKTRARLEGDSWVLNGTKAWITNSGVSEWYTVMAVTDPEKGANGISAFAVTRDDPGFAVGPKERRMGIKGSPTCELDFTRPPIGAQAVGIAQGALDARRSAASRACSSCSPTWRPSPPTSRCT